MSCRTCAPGGREARGFTYFTVLILVAIMGVGLAAIGTLWQRATLREKERELLFVGGEFRRAIASYFERSPGAAQYPRKLEDLLVDKRFPVATRHLRKIYYDPMTGSQDWGIVKEAGGGILGVYSKATGKPLKVAGFREDDKGFAAALTYADWKFVYGAGSVVGTGADAQQGFPSALVPADGQNASVPIAPPTEPATGKEDSSRDERRSACEAQRAKELAECQTADSAADQNAGASSCVAAAATRFNTCVDGSTGAGAAPSSGSPAG